MKYFFKYLFSKLGGSTVIKNYRIAKDEFIRENNFRIKYAEMHMDYYIHPSVIIDKAELVTIGFGAELQEFVIIKTMKNKVKIGKYTQINPFTVIYGGSGVEIGENVMIAPHCMIASGNHDYKQTQHPMRFAGTLSKGPIIIEDNVWIGANVTIADGVKIGKEAVIGSNSLVNRDVEPWSIVGGVPAKKIGNRMSN